MKYADNVINLLICFTIYGWWRTDQTTNHFCRLTANSCVFVCRSACMCLLRVVFVIVDRYLNSSYFKNSTLRFKHLFSFQIIVIHLKLILNKNAKKMYDCIDFGTAVNVSHASNIYYYVCRSFCISTSTAWPFLFIYNWFLSCCCRGLSPILPGHLSVRPSVCLSACVEWPEN